MSRFARTGIASCVPVETNTRRRQDAVSQEIIERDMQNGFQQLTATVDGKWQILEQRIAEVGNNVSADQINFQAAASRLHKQVSVVQKNFTSANRNSVRQHKKTRDWISRGNMKVVDTISSKIDDLPGKLARTYISSTNSGREIRYQGQSLDSTMCSLLLVKDGLRTAILKTLSEHSKLVSAEDLYWLLSEFDNLVLSAAQEFAATSEKSSARSIDKWIYQRGVASCSSTATRVPNKRLRHESELSNDTPRSEEVVQRKRRKSNYRSFSFNLPAGEMEVLVSRPNAATANATGSCSVVKVGFSFSPKPGICSTLIKGHFIKDVNTGREPRLYAQLNAFTVVESLLPYFRVFKTGTLEDVDKAFRDGTISPYGVSEFGSTMFQVRVLGTAYLSSSKRKLYPF